MALSDEELREVTDVLGGLIPWVTPSGLTKEDPSLPSLPGSFLSQVKEDDQGNAIWQLISWLKNRHWGIEKGPRECHESWIGDIAALIHSVPALDRTFVVEELSVDFRAEIEDSTRREIAKYVADHWPHGPADVLRKPWRNNNSDELAD